MTIRGTGFWGYRWEGYQHEQLYEMVTTGKGAGVVTPAQDAWAGFTQLMNQSMERIEGLQREAGVSWQGRAAGAMSEGVSPLTAWAQESATAAEQTNASLRQIADGFSHAANTMPEPVVVPSKVARGIPGDFGGLLAGQTDEDATDQRAQQARQQAIELMNGYTANNVQSADTAGTFADPPGIGVSAAPRTEPGGNAGGVIDTSSPGDSGDQTGPGNQSGPGGLRSPGEQGGPGGNGFGGGSASGPRPGGALAPTSTDPAQVIAPPPLPQPPGAGQGGVPTDPFDPVGGVPAGSGAGRGLFGGGPGHGSLGGNGGGNGGEPNGRGGGTGGEPGGRGAGAAAPGRGGTAGPGAPAAENTTGARTAAQPVSRNGAVGGGMAPGTGRRDEDEERPSPEYLRDYNDEFWDDTPPVAPAVIGEEED
jgi:hypothetical protein